MVLTGMRGTFEERGMGDGMGNVGFAGFDAGGFLKSIGKTAASGAAGALAKRATGGAKPPPKPSGGGGGYAAPGKRPLSTGAKVALGVGGVGLAAVLYKAIKGGR